MQRNMTAPKLFKCFLQINGIRCAASTVKAFSAFESKLAADARQQAEMDKAAKGMEHEKKPEVGGTTKFKKIKSGARIPTAVSCIWESRTHEQGPRNEWQMANINYDKSMMELDKNAQELYKHAKPKFTKYDQNSVTKAMNPGSANTQKLSASAQRLSSLLFSNMDELSGPRKQPNSEPPRKNSQGMVPSKELDDLNKKRRKARGDK